MSRKWTGGIVFWFGVDFIYYLDLKIVKLRWTQVQYSWSETNDLFSALKFEALLLNRLKT